MELFDIKNNQLVLNPNALVIPEFRALWERDKSKSKDNAVKELSYIVFLLSYASPYTAYSEDVRESFVKKDFIKDKNWKLDDAVKSAMDRYKEFQKTTNSELLDAVKCTAEKMSNYFRSVDFSKLNEKGQKEYDPDSVMMNLSKIGSLIKSLSILEQQVRKERLDSFTAKGGSDIGEYEIPDEDL